MKIPKTKKRFCPKCRKHTLQTVKQAKIVTGKRGELKAGQRRHNRRSNIKGYGGYPHPKMDKGSRYGVKTTKKISLMYTCPKCKKKTISRGKRSKKFKLGD